MIWYFEIFVEVEVIWISFGFIFVRIEVIWFVQCRFSAFFHFSFFFFNVSTVLLSKCGFEESTYDHTVLAKLGMHWILSLINPHGGKSNTVSSRHPKRGFISVPLVFPEMEGKVRPHLGSPALEEAEWVPLDKHHMFGGGGGGSNRNPPTTTGVLHCNLLSWDGASHLYIWDSNMCCINRLSLRFGEPASIEATSSFKVSGNSRIYQKSTY